MECCECATSFSSVDKGLQQHKQHTFHSAAASNRINCHLTAIFVTHFFNPRPCFFAVILSFRLILYSSSTLTRQHWCCCCWSLLISSSRSTLWHADFTNFSPLPSDLTRPSALECTAPRTRHFFFSGCVLFFSSSFVPLWSNDWPLTILIGSRSAQLPLSQLQNSRLL